MRGKKGTRTLLIFITALAVIFVAVTVWTASGRFKELKAGEQFSEVDYYSMQSYCDENAAAVMSALKSGNSEKLSTLIMGESNEEGAKAVTDFADWKKADFDNITGMGAGSLSPAPDAEGRMDISERFFVDAGGQKYVLLVETVTSRWGRTNDGISAVCVTTYDHFNELDYSWNGKADGMTVSCGALFWPGNQPEGTDPDY